MGLAIFGEVSSIVQHLQVLDEVGGVQVVGCFCTGGKTAELAGKIQVFRHPADLLDLTQVQGCIICTSLEEKGFWIQRALAAGKHVLCELPLASSYREARRVAPGCTRDGPRLAVVSNALFSPSGLAVKRVAEEKEIGRLLFFELNISIPRSGLAPRKEGVLLLCGVDFLGLMGEYFGPVDSVWARTRSWGWNRPAEDTVVAQFRFRDGKEGAIHINGLGERDQVWLRLYGRSGWKESSHTKAAGCWEAWRFSHLDFCQVVQAGKEPVWDGQKALKGFFFADWIQQSARLDREIFSNEVIDEP